MNSMKEKLKAVFSRKNSAKNLVISIVILVELLAIASVATFAWVETVSSIKIATRNAANQEDPLVVDSYVFTEAMIGEGKGTIDLADYFKKSGDMHLAPCSSADGERMFFPKATATAAAYQTGTGSFRKGDFSDKNTAYMSISFKLRADVNADFFFTQVPTFSEQGDNIRVSVTAYTEGMSSGDLYDAQTGKPLYTKIYANSASAANTTVVGDTSGTAVATSYAAFSNHIKGQGKTKLFSVAADETKIVTINLWLQGSAINNSLPQDISISNFGIISDLTPRHVTLIPTDRWDLSGTTEYFYAWCWESSKSGVEDRLYKLELDENEHYSFDYNGTYQKTLFIRCGNANLTTNDMKSSWSTLGLWNKTADTSIPNSPVDPTYYIQTINGGSYDSDISANKSTGDWALPDIVTIKTATVTGQSSWGTLTSASYYGTTVTSSQQVEANNSSNANAKHHDTIHALPGKKVRLNATVKSTNYAFVGWYDNAEGTGTALSTDATYDFNATTEAPKEVVYYAKFKEVRKLTIVKYLDGVATNTTTATDVGSITIGTNTSANDDVTSYSQTYDKGTTVTFSANASPGYTLTGIYTTTTGDNSVSSVTLDDNTTYYARFTTNSYNVTASAYYSTNGGTSYSAGSTGGTVKAGTSAAGATSTASVKYKSSVTLTATPASGYEFVGWYSAATGGSQLSTSTSYTYTLSTTGAKNVYARFIKLSTVTIYIAPRENWNEPDLHVWDDNGVIDDHLTASYDGATGYYKATVQTRGTWLKAILSKDSSYTEQTSDITVVSSLSTGTNYSKYINTSNTVSDWSSTSRCIWFIISEDWLKNNLKNDGDYMNIWSGSNCKMRRINDNAYVYEYSTAPTGTIYFQQFKSDNNRRNQWAAAMSGASGKSQFKETTYNSGSWQ